MQIRRIEVRSFRKLKTLVVEDLSPGLNVLVGDNEAGKSTLLAALRAVLFERHRIGGQVLKAMLPHGHDVRPEVILDFTLGDAPWRLRKAFNQRPEAELTLPTGQTVTGDAVEEQLGALLGFEAPGSRGSKPSEHQGVYGLLWVDQGLSHAPLTAGAGQDMLSAALESEVGQVLGGERGRHLVARAAERRDGFWDGRGKARGAFRQIRDDVSALEGQLAALQDRARQHDERVEALAIRADALARHQRDDRLNTAMRAVDEARRAAERSAQLQATAEELRRAADYARREREATAERQRNRQLLRDRVEAAGLAATRIAEQARDGRAALARAEDAGRRAVTERTRFRDERRALEARLDALAKHAEQQRAAAELTRLKRTLGDAERTAEQRRTAATMASSITITKPQLAGLDKLCASRDQARSRRDAASVQIVVEAGQGLLVDGTPQPDGEPLLLAGDALLELPGFGRLRVRPGGGVERLAQALDDAEAALADALRRLGQPSREAAADALARRLEAEASVAEQDRLLALVAPDGLEALRAAVARVTASAEPGVVTEQPVPDEQRFALRQALDAARRAEAAAEAEATRTAEARETASRDAAVLAERAAAASREQEAGLQALIAARTSQPDDRLADASAKAEHDIRLAESALAAAETALADSDPEAASLMLRRAEQAEAAIRADIDKLTREKRDLEVELRTLGQEGIGELLAETEGRLAAARQQLERQRLEADASLLLHSTLAAAQRETKDRWLGPVGDRVRPYLKLIQPGADLVLNEKTFAVEQLLRNGVPEPFDSLSVGAREQVAVITRLALADVLRSSGQPAAIILDDALVNTDETRLERMHLVLQRAAAHLQVLVLTCRERDFMGLGAPIHRL